MAKFTDTLQIKFEVDGDKQVVSQLSRVSDSIEDVGSSSKKSDESIIGVGNSIKLLTGAALGYAAIDLARFLISEAELWKQLSGSLAVQTEHLGSLAVNQKTVLDIAQDTRTDLSATSDLYGKLAGATAEFGASQADVAKVTEAVANSLRIQTADATTSVAVIRQLSQVFTSARFGGDEYVSLTENAATLLKAVRKELGVTVVQFREMAKESDFVVKKLFPALVTAADDLAVTAARMGESIEGSWTTVTNAMTVYIGTSDTVVNVTDIIANTLLYAGENFETLANTVIIVATALAGRYVVSMGASIAVTLTQTVAVRGLGAAFALLGGPLGIISTVAFGLAGYVLTQKESKSVTELLAEATSDMAANDKTAAIEKIKLADATLEATKALLAEYEAATQPLPGEENNLALQGHQQRTYAETIANLTAKITEQQQQIDKTRESLGLTNVAINNSGGVIKSVTSILDSYNKTAETNIGLLRIRAEQGNRAAEIEKRFQAATKKSADLSKQEAAVLREKIALDYDAESQLKSVIKARDDATAAANKSRESYENNVAALRRESEYLDRAILLGKESADSNREITETVGDYTDANQGLVASLIESNKAKREDVEYLEKARTEREATVKSIARESEGYSQQIEIQRILRDEGERAAYLKEEEIRLRDQNKQATDEEIQALIAEAAASYDATEQTREHIEQKERFNESINDLSRSLANVAQGTQDFEDVFKNMLKELLAAILQSGIKEAIEYVFNVGDKSFDVGEIFKAGGNTTIGGLFNGGGSGGNGDGVAQYGNTISSAYGTVQSAKNIKNEDGSTNYGAVASTAYKGYKTYGQVKGLLGSGTTSTGAGSSAAISTGSSAAVGNAAAGAYTGTAATGAQAAALGTQTGATLTAGQSAALSGPLAGGGTGGSLAAGAGGGAAPAAGAGAAPAAGAAPTGGLTAGSAGLAAVAFAAVLAFKNHNAKKKEGQIGRAVRDLRDNVDPNEAFSFAGGKYLGTGKEGGYIETAKNFTQIQQLAREVGGDVEIAFGAGDSLITHIKGEVSAVKDLLPAVKQEHLDYISESAASAIESSKKTGLARRDVTEAGRVAAAAATKNIVDSIKLVETNLGSVSEAAAYAFTGSTENANRFESALKDGVLTSSEQVALGMQNMGDLTAAQFKRLSEVLQQDFISAADAARVGIEGFVGGSRGEFEKFVSDSGQASNSLLAVANSSEIAAEKVRGLGRGEGTVRSISRAAKAAASSADGIGDGFKSAANSIADLNGRAARVSIIQHVETRGDALVEGTVVNAAVNFSSSLSRGGGGQGGRMLGGWLDRPGQYNVVEDGLPEFVLPGNVARFFEQSGIPINAPAAANVNIDLTPLRADLRNLRSAISQVQDAVQQNTRHRQSLKSREMADLLALDLAA